ncbi:MAG: Rho termination factor N-terminal domain-containing protein, partial [Agriterribacter sp.]
SLRPRIAYSWFPSFIEAKKNEIENLFKEDVEFFKKEIETDLEKRFKVQFEENVIKIEELKNTISKNEKLIAQLENQLGENLQSKRKNEESVTIVSEPSEAEILNVEPDKNTNGKLSSNETSIPANKLREVELDKKKMPALKALAEKYQIQKGNSLRKPELIAEIIKYESQQ